MNRHTLLLSALLLCSAVLVPAQINAPKAGVVRYLDGTVHAVYGLPANYIAGSQVLGSADTVSFSDRGGMIAKDGRILLVDPALKTLAEYDSGEAAPLLNVDGDLNSAIAWLPTNQTLVYWNGSSLVATPLNGSSVLGAVSSVAIAGSNTAKLLVTNSDGTVSEATVSLSTGELTSLDSLPGVRGPAFLQQSFVVYDGPGGLSVANASSVLRTFPLPATGLKFERMSSDAVHISSPASGQNWVLHLGNSTAPQLWQLPELPASSSGNTAQESQK